MTGSHTSRRSPTWLIATSIVLVLLAVYVAGYFWLGEYDVDRSVSVTYHYRTFSNSAFVDAYIPLGLIESRSRHDYVVLVAPSDSDPLGITTTMFDPF
jgi:hypothetical protein